MTKKNLSILIYSLASGGAERVVSILLNELKDKYNIRLFLMNNIIFYDIPENIKVVYLENSDPKESGIKKLLKLPLLAWRYRSLNKSEISLSFMNRPNYINVLAKLIGMRSKVIVSERAMPSLQHKNGLQGMINRFLIKNLYNRSDLVIANSKGNQYDLKQNFNIQNINAIYNPVDKIKIDNSRQEKFIFITVGRIDEGKNHKLLVKSFNKLDLESELWIIGDGPLKNDLEKIPNEKIKFLGRKKNVFKYLKQADCFVFSSNYEGFPNVLLEALICNLPIISTDCQSGPREILAPDTNFKKQIKSDIEIAKYGILTPVKDERSMLKAMNIMLNDDKLRDNYKYKAKDRIDDFNKDKIIKEWIKVIEK